MSGPNMTQSDSSPCVSPGSSTTHSVTNPIAAPQHINGAMFVKLLTLIEEVKDTQRVHGQMLNTLLKKDAMPVLEIPDGAVFPLTKVDDVNSMNERLSDTGFMSAVVSF